MGHLFIMGVENKQIAHRQRFVCSYVITQADIAIATALIVQHYTQLSNTIHAAEDSSLHEPVPESGFI